MSRSSDYQHLAERLADAGVDVSVVQASLAALTIETPSWGYGDSGTRFATFLSRGRPRNVFERIDDAAEVHRVTGTAGAVALHIPWDAVDDLAELGDHIASRSLKVGPVNPNLFQDPDYLLGSVTHHDRAIRRKATDHLLECVRIACELGSTALSLWLADGTNYPGQGDMLQRRERMLACLTEVYAAMPAEQELLIEYKPFEPAFYSTDVADWGSALLVCQRLGERARVLVDLGHHLHGSNLEQIVTLLGSESRLGGFHFNNRKYADDDLIVGSVNPFELFLIFVQLTALDTLARLTIDQAHNIESKIEAMAASVLNLQESYVKALIVDRSALRDAQENGDVLGAHRVLTDAFATDVRPLCAEVREDLGATRDPLAELRRPDGYLARVAADRGAGTGIG